MKNSSTKGKTFIKIFIILAIILIGVVVLCDFTPSSQPQEVVIPFTR